MNNATQQNVSRGVQWLWNYFRLPLATHKKGSVAVYYLKFQLSCTTCCSTHNRQCTNLLQLKISHQSALVKRHFENQWFGIGSHMRAYTWIYASRPCYMHLKANGHLWTVFLQTFVVHIYLRDRTTCLCHRFLKVWYHSHRLILLNI